MPLHDLTLEQAHALLQRGEISSVELTQALLDRIAVKDKEISAYLTVTAEGAIAAARQADARRVAGEETPLLGIPIAIKDIIHIRGVPTTCGSRILEGFVPAFSATVIHRLQAAGAVLLGKTNTDEFAMGSSTENSAYFTTRNPWSLERVPGGSSGGSAAAVSGRMAFAALGSDTGGSVRQPAAFCGAVGIKPTYGRVSRYGLVAFASSLDQIGPIARNVMDAAILLGVIAGHDPRDSTSSKAPVPDYQAGCWRPAGAGDGLNGLRVGTPAEYLVPGMQPRVTAAVREAIATLEKLGAEIIEISLPHTKYALPAYYLIAPAEASANLARYDGMRYGLRVLGQDVGNTYEQTRAQGFGAEVTRRIMLGTFALRAGYYDAYYLKAQKARTLIRQDFDAAFERVDVIATPTTPTTAFRVGEKMDNPLEMYLADVFTLSMNLAGICGLSLPCGFDDQSLPIGLQLMGPALGEVVVLQAAHAYEQATGWHKERPAL
ncbi:MAG: Asp-tRNA(Asn)/Glu-tRNA(Gln) amidotransferase subunit GatA [Ardenticatenales bacterium]|nr:Asp-tRNA(Asn)/Glu-tRNA(Gln) amidotransferase subunit GatA [Ardenticatenales bacterium]